MFFVIGVDLLYHEVIRDFSRSLKDFKEQKKNIRRLWNLGKASARFIFETIQKIEPADILEIGTSNGYSTFWIALAAEKYGGFVESIEVDKKRFELAARNLKMLSNVKLYQGMAEEIIPELEGKYDLVFIDANKTSYLTYLKLLLTRMNSRCLIIADNVISHADSVHEYLDFVRTNNLFVSRTVEIENGMEISIYKSDI